VGIDHLFGDSPEQAAHAVVKRCDYHALGIIELDQVRNRKSERAPRAVQNTDRR